MEKIKVEIPAVILFRSEFTIQPEDINEANHMGNERILHHANLLRCDFFKTLDILPPDVNHGFIIANHSIQYRSEGFVNDVIRCEAGVSNVTECSFDLVLHFIKIQKSLAVVRSGLIYFDYTHRKIRHLPGNCLNVLTP